LYTTGSEFVIYHFKILFLNHDLTTCNF